MYYRGGIVVESSPKPCRTLCNLSLSWQLTVSNACFNNDFNELFLSRFLIFFLKNVTGGWIVPWVCLLFLNFDRLTCWLDQTSVTQSLSQGWKVAIVTPDTFPLTPKACLLRHALYGLKQALWVGLQHIQFHYYSTMIHRTSSSHDWTLFTYRTPPENFQKYYMQIDK